MLFSTISRLVAAYFGAYRQASDFFRLLLRRKVKRWLMLRCEMLTCSQQGAETRDKSDDLPNTLIILQKKVRGWYIDRQTEGLINLIKDRLIREPTEIFLGQLKLVHNRGRKKKNQTTMKVTNTLAYSTLDPDVPHSGTFQWQEAVRRRPRSQKLDER